MNEDLNQLVGKSIKKMEKWKDSVTFFTDKDEEFKFECVKDSKMYTYLIGIDIYDESKFFNSTILNIEYSIHFSNHPIYTNYCDYKLNTSDAYINIRWGSYGKSTVSYINTNFYKPDRELENNIDLINSKIFYS